MVTLRRSMFALLQFVCIYSDVLLKRAQSKKNVEKSTMVPSPWVKEHKVLMLRKCR